MTAMWAILGRVFSLALVLDRLARIDDYIEECDLVVMIKRIDK
jgi:hypothetical protein